MGKGDKVLYTTAPVLVAVGRLPALAVVQLVADSCVHSPHGRTIVWLAVQTGPSGLACRVGTVEPVPAVGVSLVS